MRRTEILRGTPASPGVDSGRVLIVVDPASAIQGKRRTVLVAPFTTPMMTIAILNASAIVTEQGGITSHAATICRELGIACIVGAKNATKKLRKGRR